jgi:alkanesulfonate monooxygenase SsuD/methylene tetrahydromethanopterin reductase-like flavin-dependent oxidoreductase (luciferase family)
VEDAKLYTRPERPPALFGAAMTDVTARWLGGWADGLITVGAPPDQLRKLLDAFRDGGGEGKPIKIQCAFAWAATDEEARRSAHREWAANMLGTDVLAMLRTPEHFEAASRFISVEEVANRLPVSSDPARHVEHLHVYAEMGVDEVYLHNVARDQPDFIDVFGARVLPQLRSGV